MFVPSSEMLHPCFFPEEPACPWAAGALQSGQNGKALSFQAWSLTSLIDPPLQLCLAEGPKLQGLRVGTSRTYPNFTITEPCLV